MNVCKLLKNSAITIATSACLMTSGAHAEVVFQSDPVLSSGFADMRSGSSAAVGRISVDMTQEINQIGTLNWLQGSNTQNLKFFIANASTGALEYLSLAKTFADDGIAGPNSTTSLTYKLSDVFSFIFNAGTTYAVGYISTGTNYTFADFSQTNTANGFTSLLGNVNVSNFANPTLDTTTNCCSIGFELIKTDAVSAVPEPESYTMLLAGLGLMGFMLRSRKTS